MIKIIPYKYKELKNETDYENNFNLENKMIFLMLINLLDNNISLSDRTKFELKRLKKYLENLNIEITELNKKQELKILEKYLKEYYDKTDKLDKYCIIIYDLYILCIKYNPIRFKEILNFYNEFEILYLNHLKSLVELEYESNIIFEANNSEHILSYNQIKNL